MLTILHGKKRRELYVCQTLYKHLIDNERHSHNLHKNEIGKNHVNHVEGRDCMSIYIK